MTSKEEEYEEIAYEYEDHEEAKETNGNNKYELISNKIKLLGMVIMWESSLLDSRIFYWNLNYRKQLLIADLSIPLKFNRNVYHMLW